MKATDITNGRAFFSAVSLAPRASLVVAFVLAASIGGMPSAAEHPPSSPPFLTFLNDPGPGQPLLAPPRLLMGVGTELRPAVVDTGSTGVVMSATSIPGADILRSLGEGRLTYSSSGRVMVGRWLVTLLTLAGRAGRVDTEPMPVLAVDRVECTSTARHCIPNDHPT